MIVSALAVSCTDDELVKGGDKYEVVPDIPVALSLKIKVADQMEVQTRLAQSDETERTVNKLFVIAFKPSKQSDGAENADASDDEWSVDNSAFYDTEDGLGNPIEVGKPQSVEFSMTTGLRRIYVVGNPQSGVGTLSDDELKNVKTIAALKALYSKLSDNLSVERVYFLMTGQAITKEKSEIVTVYKSGDHQGAIREDYTMALNHVDARITFNIIPAVGVTFEPEAYRVINIPGGTYLFSREKQNSGDNTWDYDGAGYAPSNRLSDFTEKDGKSIFEFYICENRQNPKQKISTESLLEEGTYYALREKQEKKLITGTVEGQKYENGEYVYANAKSTYVELEGTITYKDDDGSEVYAKTTYTIHLGNTGNSNTADWLNDLELVNNYDTERNTHYTYNVKVQSVDQIIVEVEDSKEVNPGAEGDVIVAQGTVKTMDSHYGRLLLTLRKEDIQKGLSWSVTTPFQRGMKVFDTKLPYDGYGLPQTDLSLNDYKWVKFLVNKECRLANGNYVPTNVMAKYPGEQAYDGGGKNNSEAAPIAGGEYIETQFYGHVRLYDINQLLNFLHVEANNGNSDIFERRWNSETFEYEDVVTITAYVDEYIYVYDPRMIYYRQAASVGLPGSGDGIEGVNLELWKETVNGENRMLNFCVEGSKYSEDGESSVARSVYSIAQNPVYTFYNPKHADLKTAWGTEAMMETKFLPIVPDGVSDEDFNSRFSGQNPNGMENGRLNMLNLINARQTVNQLHWTDVLGVVTDVDHQLNSGYESIWYACLLRNRDLDGDDVIDADEIRWYLASVDQLTDLWIGETAIPKAKLYMNDIDASGVEIPIENGETRVHVASSSYHPGTTDKPTNKPSDPWVIWAEESASRGSASYSQTAHGEHFTGIKNFSYRCIRNLGLSLKDIDAVPEDYVTKGSSTHIIGGVTYKEKTIDINPMIDNTIRPSVGTEVLPTNTERDISGNNRPPLTLAILADEGDISYGVYPEEGSIGAERVAKYERVDRPCPIGYRAPNQRELMLMYTTYPDLMTGFTYLTNTTFSGRNTDIGQGVGSTTNRKEAFAYTSGTLQLTTGWGSGKVRCVRDATNNLGGN